VQTVCAGILWWQWWHVTNFGAESAWFVRLFRPRALEWRRFGSGIWLRPRIANRTPPNPPATSTRKCRLT